MNNFKKLLRIFQISAILSKNGLDRLLVSSELFSSYRFIIFFNPWNWWRWGRRKKKDTRGEALRKSLEELGPIFVKFGQMLSTRPDILPPDIAAELSLLQDNVAPFSGEIALSLIEAEFNQAALDVFASFDLKPLASASIAQVHAAVLKTGEKVVVKILRPSIEVLIKKDLSILHSIAHFLERYWEESRRLKPKELIKEFEHNLIDELDLQREAANACQLKRNFAHSSLLYVPEIHWDYTRQRVLVMERIYGIPVSNVALLKEKGINIKKLAERGVEIFFTQVFRDCFFHADMHPGNIFVSPEYQEEPQYICVDFGIIGTLNDKDKRYLAETLYAFFNRDYQRVAQLHVASGWVAPQTRVEDFESAVRTICEPIFEKPLKDISFAIVVMRFLQVARRFNMEVQPQLVLLQKTLLAVEGLGRQLYPELDLWATGKPFLEKWLKQQMGPRAFLREIKENIPFLVEELPRLPKLFYDVLLFNKEYLSSQTNYNKVTKSQFKTNRRTFLSAMMLGALLCLATIHLLNYLQWLSAANLSLITLAVLVIALFFL